MICAIEVKYEEQDQSSFERSFHVASSQVVAVLCLAHRILSRAPQVERGSENAAFELIGEGSVGFGVKGRLYVHLLEEP